MNGLKANRFVSIVALVLLVSLAGCGGKSPEELLASAKVLQSKGERAAAILEMKSLLQEHPEHAPSRLFLGQLYVEAGDLRGAEKELRRALELQADPTRVLPALARTLVMQGEAKKALTDISAGTLQDPEAIAGVLSAHGLAHIALRQPEDARAAFEKALSAKPGYPDALVGKARLLASERKIDEAIVEVDRALTGSSAHSDALMFRGDLLRAKGRIDDAKLAYEKLVEAHPDNLNGHLALVSLAVATERFDDARKHLTQAQKASPGSLMAAYFHALIAFRKREFQVARDAVGAVLKAAPNHLPSVLLGGAVEFALGSQELAQARLKYVLDKAPGNLYARRLLVASYARAGQTHKAMEILEPVLKQGTKDPGILALAGEIHMQMNEYDKARTYFSQASSLDPKNAAMRTGLGLSRLAAGEIEGATADLESAAQLDTTKHQADVLLISTHLQRRDYDQALKAAQSLVSKQPDSPSAHNLLAAAYIGKKDLASARREFSKALELQPTYYPAAANLAQLDLKSGDKQAARKRFENILAKDKSNVQAYIALAALGPAIDANQSEVMGWLEAARRESPGTIQPLVMLARFHLSAGEPKKALELMEKALISAPDRGDVLDLAGQVQIAAGERNRAMATFAKWVAVQPSALSYYRLGTAQLVNQDPTSAMSSLKKALAYRPQFPEAQVSLAEIHAKAGRVGEALRISKAVQQQNAKSPLGWILEGDIKMFDKQFDQAAAAYEKAYALSKNGSTVIKMHAALSRAGRRAVGESRTREWLKIRPNDAAVRLYLAENFLRDAQYAKAIKEYELLDGVHSGNVVVLNNLAWAYHQAKDARAAETAERALKIKPDNPAVLDTLGIILLERGQVQRAVELLRKGAALAPKAPTIRYHYAMGLAKAGEKAKSRDELERLLVEFPKFPESDKAVKLLAEVRGG